MNMVEEIRMWLRESNRIQIKCIIKMFMFCIFGNFHFNLTISKYIFTFLYEFIAINNCIIKKTKKLCIIWLVFDWRRVTLIFLFFSCLLFVYNFLVSIEYQNEFIWLNWLKGCNMCWNYDDSYRIFIHSSFIDVINWSHFKSFTDQINRNSNATNNKNRDQQSWTECEHNKNTLHMMSISIQFCLDQLTITHFSSLAFHLSCSFVHSHIFFVLVLFFCFLHIIFSYV